ncbi:hypothetical protein [Alloscardovia criceti]|uniref:hypothetical protein n=1 Tax=Alloscardovia criceti TaxID=356828 RepID=UPI0012E9E77E|nr:hypothetical protein [Alloscardovia criceti]
MSDVFKDSETSRIKRFYHERFGGAADNVVVAYQQLIDGIDIWVFGNLDFTKDLLLKAAHASSLPTRREAEILARNYAAFLSSPYR